MDVKSKRAKEKKRKYAMNKTKTKHDKSFYIDRATNDFKTLVIYFNVTRPQHQKGYFGKDEKFSKEKMDEQLSFLHKWHEMSTSERRHYAKQYTQYSKTFNYTFSIPCDLVNKVLGCYRDENGKKCRISIDDVLPQLIESGFVRVMNAGRKIDQETKKVKCWWFKKYLISSAYRSTLMNDNRYSDILNFPYASQRIKDIVVNWVKSQKKDDTPPLPRNVNEMTAMWNTGKYSEEEFKKIIDAAVEKYGIREIVK